MPSLPPLDCLRMLEKYLGDTLFERRRPSVRLNRRGRAYLGDVQPILADIRDATERHSSRDNRRLRIVSVEGVGERWLMPRLVRFKASHPDIAIELETHYGNVGPGGRDFDFWLTYVANDAPQLHRIPDALVKDTLFEEPLIPFCSPTFIQARTPRHTGRPARLAAAVPSRLGGRLAILVHLPRRTRAGLD